MILNWFGVSENVYIYVRAVIKRIIQVNKAIETKLNSPLKVLNIHKHMKAKDTISHM